MISILEMGVFAHRFSLRYLTTIGLVAIAVAWTGFQLGTYSAKSEAARWISQRRVEAERDSELNENAESYRVDSKNIEIRNVAYAPFTDLYEIFRRATPIELLNWAADLNRLPIGPQRSAAITAFYKTLIQVNPDAAIQAVLQIGDARLRDLAIGGLDRGAPQSLLPKIAEMLLRTPHRKGTALSSEFISDWSSIDPEAVSKFLNEHPEEAARNSLFFDVLYNWGAIDPKGAVAWLSENPSRQDKDTIRGLIQGWEGTDRAGAVNYAVNNAANPVFESGRNELAYTLLRKAPDDARAMILRLPVAQAIETVKHIAEQTTVVFLHAPEDYQRPPDVVAKWMVTLAPNLWEQNIGAVISYWDKEDSGSARAWLNQLEPSVRDFAVADFCRSAIGEKDSPESIIRIGMTVTDPKLRSEAIGEFMRGLGETREEALQKLNNLSLSRQEKAYLQRVMPEFRHEG
jgi:hypothetical protein